MMMITVLNIGIVRQCAIGMRVAAAIYHYSPVISASVSVVIIIEMSALGICFVLWLRPPLDETNRLRPFGEFVQRTSAAIYVNDFVISFSSLP